MEASLSLLPVDALRRIFRSLDWRSVCSCACVCSSWHALAAENLVWHKHVTQEYFRPSLLAYSAAQLPVGWKHTGAAAQDAAITAAAAAAHASLLKGNQPNAAGNVDSREQQQAAASAGGQAVGATSNPQGVLKSLFSAGLLHAAAPHQAHLARFHAALSCITGWRLVLTANATSAPAQATASTTAASSSAQDSAAFASLSLSDPAAPYSSSLAPAQGSAQAGVQSSAAAPASSQAHNMQANTAASPAGGDSAAPAGGSAVRSIGSRTGPVCGDPAPLTLQALQCGGWACGCVMMQQQEQSCWVRFNLPAQLKTDQEVAEALKAGNITAVVQGLGPSGWFDAATSAKFELSDDDMEILMQSHKTGFYAWDQLEEEGVDRYGQLNPLPWDLNPGQHQEQDQQQQQPQGGGQPQEAVSPAAAPVQPKLRMLVYVHYEQLLQTLPWALPHILPLPTHPVFETHEDIARHLLASPASLWLQLDVCRLHGGYRLGTCMVPLALSDCNFACAKFRCIEDQLLVVLYRPDSSINSTKGVSGPASGAGGAGEQEAAEDQPAGSLAAADAAGSPPPSAAAAGLTAWPRIGCVLGQDACQQVLLGDRCIFGNDSSSSQDGGVLRTAADAMQELMVTDEIMIDFAVFDHNGHLLMGRAGVEVWSKEDSERGYIQQLVPQSAPSGTPANSSADAQPQQQVQGRSASADDGAQQATALARLDYLTAHIRVSGPLQIMPRRHGVEQSLLPCHELQELERMRLAVEIDKEDIRASQEEDQSAAPTIQHTRTQQRLHFLVDGCGSSFWQTCILVDAQRPPAGFVRYGRGPVSTVSMDLLWSSLRALFGLAPFAE